VPEIAGTLPEVKLRPRVTKRPTISAPRLPEKKPFVEKKAEPKPEPSQRYLIGATIPEKKPLVKRKAESNPDQRPTVTGATMPKKKPLVTKKAKTAAEAKPTLKRTFTFRPWYPIAAGIALAFLAPTIHTLASHWDPWGLRVVFPFVQLTGLHEIGMSDELTRTMPQLMLYLQFPLEGILVADNLRRGMGPVKAIGPIVPLHFVAVLVLWIVALGSSRLI
jgi:hypothetical protein